MIHTSKGSSINYSNQHHTNKGFYLEEKAFTPLSTASLKKITRFHPSFINSSGPQNYFYEDKLWTRRCKTGIWNDNEIRHNEHYENTPLRDDQPALLRENPYPKSLFHQDWTWLDALIAIGFTEKVQFIVT